MAAADKPLRQPVYLVDEARCERLRRVRARLGAASDSDAIRQLIDAAAEALGCAGPRLPADFILPTSTPRLRSIAGPPRMSCRSSSDDQEEPVHRTAHAGCARVFGPPPAPEMTSAPIPAGAGRHP